MAQQPRESRSGNRRSRRHQKRRARELRRVTLAGVFVFLQVTGFWLANFADRDSWRELSGFLLLQPVQIVLNTIDSRFQLTRGMHDADAVMLVTLLSLPLNVCFWYWVWRGWHKLRRDLRRRKYAPGTAFGPASRPAAGSTYGSPAASRSGPRIVAASQSASLQSAVLQNAVSQSAASPNAGPLPNTVAKHSDEAVSPLRE